MTGFVAPVRSQREEWVAFGEWLVALVPGLQRQGILQWPYSFLAFSLK